MNCETGSFYNTSTNTHKTVQNQCFTYHSQTSKQTHRQSNHNVIAVFQVSKAGMSSNTISHIQMYTISRMGQNRMSSRTVKQCHFTMFYVEITMCLTFCNKHLDTQNHTNKHNISKTMCLTTTIANKHVITISNTKLTQSHEQTHYQ